MPKAWQKSAHGKLAPKPLQVASAHEASRPCRQAEDGVRSREPGGHGFMHSASASAGMGHSSIASFRRTKQSCSKTLNCTCDPLRHATAAAVVSIWLADIVGASLPNQRTGSLSSVTTPIGFEPTWPAPSARFWDGIGRKAQDGLGAMRNRALPTAICKESSTSRKT